MPTADQSAAVAEQVEYLDIRLGHLTEKMKALDQGLFPYLADSMAETEIELRNLGSRLEVAERRLLHAEDSKTWYDWFALGVTSMGLVQGLVGIAFTILKWRQRRRPATNPA